MDVRLLYSHDGMNWLPTDNGRPFLEPRHKDHWDRHMVSIVSPPVRVGDEWYFYHGGSRAHHDWWWAGPYELDHEEAREPTAHVEFGMGIAALRFEGMVSLDAISPRPGRVITRPLRFSGTSLKINAKARRNGSVRAALCDSKGKVLAGYGLDDCAPLTGDGVRQEVRWTNAAALPPPDQNGFRKLIFALDEAEIFGFVIE
jgi:hypothetical protein